MPIVTLAEAARRKKLLAQRFWPTVMRGVKVGALRMRAHMVQASRDAGVLNTGAYARGWKADVLARSVLVYNQTPYSGVIEEGRRPGRRQPPTKVIEPWVRRKLGLRGGEAKSVAFLVARKIGRVGIPGKHVLSRQTARLGELLRDEVNDSIRLELRR
jgi:hypothetical protein